MTRRQHELDGSRFWKLLRLTLPLLTLSASLLGQTPAFTSFDAPHAGTGADQGTYPVGINVNGVIAGLYIDNGNVKHGFLRQPNGTFTEFSPPHMADVNIYGLNRQGEVIGIGSTVLIPPYLYSGFLRNPNGSYAIFAPTGAKYTVPLGINDSGAIVGYYYDAAGTYHGFLRTVGNGITVIDNPDASTGSGNGTRASAINANGTIAGYYTDINTGTQRGFIRDSSGNFTNFDVAAISPVYPQVPSINLSGEVAGTYSDASNDIAGFVRDASGTVSDFSVPSSTLTIAYSMNDNGVIVGYWYNTEGNALAFERDAAGDFITFSAPKPHLFTLATGVNNSVRITGVWRDLKLVDHGFVQ
ncbi:MAG TPA: hypothetical protein VE377_22370 [Candidatus Dormibacteraeota bacterium]|nr:hypothetical protein [Candidatus Dormibacteraeota bacterium]